MACGDGVFAFQEIEWVEKVNCSPHDFAMA